MDTACKDQSYFELKVELSKIESRDLLTSTLRFSTVPQSFKDIRREIEDCCSVPMCVQTILYQNSEVSDSATPDSLYMRSGDTVVVLYPEKGQVKEVRQVIKWLQQVYNIMLGFQWALKSDLRPSVSEESRAILINSDVAEQLTSLFSSWSDSETKVNAEYFYSLGGLELMVKVHKLVVELRKQEGAVYPVNLPYFEFYCCRAFANFAMDSKFSKCVARCGGLESCIETLLIRPADDQTLKIGTTYMVLVTALRAIFK